VKALIEPVDGLTINSCSAGDFSAVWAAGAWSPVDYITDSEGATIIFGNAIDALHRLWLNASQIRQLWRNSKISYPLDGFHVAVDYEQDGRLIVGADLLGMFPVYYWSSKNVVLVGSSPELFRHHPCFDVKIDEEGLVGILLSKGLVNGRTMLSGVRRLAAGHLLQWKSRVQASEINQFSLPVSTKYFEMSLSEQVEVLDKALEEAVTRHVPRDAECCLMLSGGLDSTLMAAYLKRTGYEITAITEGLKTDNEMKCAKQIADALGIKHIQFQIDADKYKQYAEITVRWQHLSEGFTAVPFWGYYDHLRKIAPNVVTGFAGDGILGSMIDWSLANQAAVSSFDVFFEKMNSQAFTPDVLRNLLKEKYYEKFVARIVHEIKENSDRYPGLAFQRIWGFGLNQRIRFHDLSGIWAISFGAWPVQPFADSRLLDTIGGFPIESLATRRLERELLRLKFPKLAKLPLAGNRSINPTPITSDFQNNIQHQIYGNTRISKLDKLHQLRRQTLLKLKGERRYWLRKFDFNSSEWKIVRSTAEPFIFLTKSFFRSEALEELMPPADSRFLKVRLKMKNSGVKYHSSLRLILGLALWLKNYPDALSMLQKKDSILTQKTLST